MKGYLEKIAAAAASIDEVDFNPCDFGGGNYADAWIVVIDGRILLVRELLEKLHPTPWH